MRHDQIFCCLCITDAVLIEPPEVRGASVEDAIAWIEAFEVETPTRIMWHMARQLNGVFGPRRLFEMGPGRKQWPVRKVDRN